MLFFMYFKRSYLPRATKEHFWRLKTIFFLNDGNLGFVADEHTKTNPVHMFFRRFRTLRVQITVLERKSPFLKLKTTFGGRKTFVLLKENTGF